MKFHKFLIAATAVFAAGCLHSQVKNTFDLTAYNFNHNPIVAYRKKHIQLLIPAPTAIKQLDGEDLLIKDQANAIAYLHAAQWSDRLPNLVQTRLVQAFENSHLFAAVGRPGQGLAINYELITDIRAFNIVLNSQGYNDIEVEFGASLLREKDGIVIASRRFNIKEPIDVATNIATKAVHNLSGYVYAPALNQAFNEIARQMILWSSKNV